MQDIALNLLASWCLRLMEGADIAPAIEKYKKPGYEFSWGELAAERWRPALKFVKFRSGSTTAMAVEQNPNKSSKWADLARAGRKVVWVWVKKPGSPQRWYCYTVQGNIVWRVHPDNPPTAVWRVK